jgi:hypothetical protein
MANMLGFVFFDEDKDKDEEVVYFGDSNSNFDESEKGE